MVPPGTVMLDHNSSSRNLSQMAEEASCAVPVLNWISIQSVPSDPMHMHTPVPAIRPLSTAHGYPMSVLWLEY